MPEALTTLVFFLSEYWIAIYWKVCLSLSTPVHNVMWGSECTRFGDLCILVQQIYFLCKWSMANTVNPLRAVITVALVDHSRWSTVFSIKCIQSDERIIFQSFFPSYDKNSLTENNILLTKTLALRTHFVNVFWNGCWEIQLFKIRKHYFTIYLGLISFIHQVQNQQHILKDKLDPLQ